MAEVLILIDTKFQNKKEFLIDRIDSNKFTLASIEKPYSKLTICKKNLQVSFQLGTPCRDNIFCLQPCENEKENVYILRTHNVRNYFLWAYFLIKWKFLYNWKSVLGNYICIGVDSLSNLHANTYQQENSSLSFQFSSSFTTACNLNVTYSVHDIPNFSFQCRKWQYRRFLNEGYLHLSNIVTKKRIDASRSLLIRTLGIPGSIVAGGVQGEGIGKFTGGLCNCTEIIQLLEGKLGAVVDCFLGDDHYDSAHIGVQIAFRFPENPLNQTSCKSENSDSKLMFYLSHFTCLN